MLNLRTVNPKYLIGNEGTFYIKILDLFTEGTSLAYETMKNFCSRFSKRKEHNLT